jgi:hypothetical protein
MRAAIAAVLVLGLILQSCASSRAGLSNQELKRELVALKGAHDSNLDSYAALLRVKVRREGRVDDFRVELFSAADTVSIYVRGFLGKSILKALVVADSLAAYFPGENLVYYGKRGDLAVDRLAAAGPIIDLILTTFRGTVFVPESPGWDYLIKERGNYYEIDQRNQQYQCRVVTAFEVNRRGFPNLRLGRIESESSDGEFRMRVDIKDSDYNREIPASKFELGLPPLTPVMTREELADLLLEIS